MTTQDNLKSAATESQQPLSLKAMIGAIATVFIVNFVILGYAVHTVESSMDHALGLLDSPISINVGSPSGNYEAAPDATPVGDVLRILVRNPIPWPQEERVRELYLRHCYGCHGSEGRGDGPGAALLLPRPRNFVESPFHFVPPNGTETETIMAVRRTIERGVPQSAMLGWKGVLSEAEIVGLAKYVYDIRAASGEIWPVLAADAGERPPFTTELVTRGRNLFTTLACNSCHGDTGHGDGASAENQVDFLGNPARPADLAFGLYKAGQSPHDLCRAILSGIPGTPMASFDAVVGRENEDGSRNVIDGWALVAYIMSLAPPSSPPGVVSGATINLVPIENEAMLNDPNDPAWLGIEPAVVALKPFQQGLNQPTQISVRAVRGPSQVGLCLEWRVKTMNVPVDENSMLDAVAAMFSMSEEVPALPMGAQGEDQTEKTLVNIWHWSADRPGAAALAADPGSISQRQHVQEANAEGFGSLEMQPPDDQNVAATALWSNGLWRVVLVRPLETVGDTDVDFLAARRIPISFAVWDGAKGDQGSLKQITGWHWLQIPSMP